MFSAFDSVGVEKVESHQAKNREQVKELTPGVLDALSNIIYQSHTHKVSTEFINCIFSECKISKL